MWRDSRVRCTKGLCIPDFTKEMPSLSFAKATSSFPVFLTRAVTERTLKLGSGDTPVTGNGFQTIPHSTFPAKPASCYYVNRIPRTVGAENAL